MKRRVIGFTLVTGAVTLVSLALAASSVPAGLVTSHLIVDRFADQAIDSNVWWVGTNQPDHITLSEGEGHLTVDVSGSATNDFNAGIGTLCKAHGDFDARLSFDLPVWSEFDGVWVSLMAADTPGFNTYRASASWGDSYGAYLPPAGTTIPASGSRDTLRLVRDGSTWSGYYLAGHKWVLIAEGSGPTNDTAINLGVFNISVATPFGGLPAQIDFDSFRLYAEAIVCSQ